MSRGDDKFSYLDTTSGPKLQTIKQQQEIINKIFPPETMTGYCLGIPGAGLQAERHRDEYRSYGIPDERQVMIDLSDEVCRTQHEYMSKLNYKGAIKKGDLMDVAHSYWKQNKQIDVIDYDDVSHLEPCHEKAIRDAAKHNVKAMILVITNRCSRLSDYHIFWKEKFNLKREIIRPCRGFTEPFSKIQCYAVKYIANECDYDVKVIPYPGREKGPPMLSFVLTKRVS